MQQYRQTEAQGQVWLTRCSKDWVRATFMKIHSDFFLPKTKAEQCWFCCRRGQIHFWQFQLQNVLLAPTCEILLFQSNMNYYKEQMIKQISYNDCGWWQVLPNFIIFIHHAQYSCTELNMAGLKNTSGLDPQKKKKKITKIKHPPTIDCTNTFTHTF